MSECPIGLIECRYPNTCFKFCGTCIRRKQEDELLAMLSEAKKDAIKEFVDAYVQSTDTDLDGICRDCKRDDDCCCIKCFRDRYLE